MQRERTTVVRRAQPVVIKDRDENFVKVPNGAIDSQPWREDNPCASNLLLYLIRRIVRAPMKDGLNIYNNYYRNDWLVCSVPQDKLAKAFNVSVRTIIRWLKNLEKNGSIRIEKIHIDGYKKQNIYVVGTHKNYDACLFIEEIYTNK